MTAPTREAVEALLALEAKATPRPWYATDKEYALRDDNGETIETEMHDFGDVWTVSTNRDVPGWCTDGGYPGYGLSKENATLIAAARNLIRPLAEFYLATLDARREGEREALRGIRDFCESMSCDLTWKRAITEIDRRLAEGETT